MTRVVGSRNRSDIELDPREAFRRGCMLDAMLQCARPVAPRGVIRATHAQLNALDDARALEMARRVNTVR
ncbi:MAG TPA: hypothetical protein VLJ86_07895 [Ramlibacter sp.]|nr:hypothetical protein [Ramlibacter sp.]